MFLSKKNAIYFNKPKQMDLTKPKRILGGNFKFIMKQAGNRMNSKNKTKSITNKNSK